MPIDFASVVYAPNYAVFARPIIVAPIKSQPTLPSYEARGIYNTVSIDVVALDGSIISEQKTIIDVLEKDFVVLPVQHDHISIPANSGLPDLGTWEIIDSNTNGGGETTFELKKVVGMQPSVQQPA